MSNNKFGLKFNFGEKPLVMPSINHAFVVVPQQSVDQLYAELDKSKVVRGIILLHYLTQGSVLLRVCPEPFVKEGPSRIDVVSFNSMRKKCWSYHGDKIYYSKFVPLVGQNGEELSPEGKAKLISYYFNSASAMRLSTVEDRRTKNFWALSGEKFIPMKKSFSLRALLSSFFS
ncbi:hypothetical protein HKT13_18075 [Pseudomonas nitrititolerans]|nr:hypothetical protein [Stutzerimonas nitrititolerans]